MVLNVRYLANSNRYSNTPQLDYQTIISNFARNLNVSLPKEVVIKGTA